MRVDRDPPSETPTPDSAFEEMPRSDRRENGTSEPESSAADSSAAATPAMGDFSRSMIGRRFAGFEIQAVAGRGGMGVVFRSVHVESGTPVALKVVPVLTRRDREPIRRFLSEARVLARLDHPNITKIHTMGRVGHMYYIGTEYIRGRTVAQWIDKGRSFTPLQALSVVRQVCEGLTVAHRHGILHRDVKSDNIMIAREGRVKILDFGIAQDLHARKRITHGDFCLGNPEYCSPEQLSTGVVDARTDIYSLGIVLYEMLTGEVPFHGMPTIEVYLAKRRNRLPSLRRAIPGSPRPLRKLVRTMLHPRPEKRFGSVEEVIASIEEVRPALGEFGSTQPADTRRRRAARRKSRLLPRAIASLF